MAASTRPRNSRRRTAIRCMSMAVTPVAMSRNPARMGPYSSRRDGNVSAWKEAALDGAEREPVLQNLRRIGKVDFDDRGAEAGEGGPRTLEGTRRVIIRFRAP